ncbi:MULTISPECIES: lasso RiPP family leader peptide-containing protein [unclassified Frankia]|uniref:lasso RiPP family leader peptide-containing protein n=1 Tax=unclassified Frankia TaxID=2632575 RepID=UPI002AD4518B|nr:MULTISPECIES: lasso RiPP family leader peptide-containing protein [unclassified Frankia]
MKASYEAPALHEAGAFATITGGHYWGHGRDFFGRRRGFRDFGEFEGRRGRFGGK